MDSKLETYLRKNNISFAEYKHPPVFTVEESKKLKQEIPGMHCKCLFLKDEKNNFYIVALPAEKRLDTKKIRTFMNLKKLNFGSPEELKLFHLEPGSVSIFGAIYSNDVCLIIDKEIFEASSAGFHPNINTSTLVLSNKELKRFYDSLKIKKYILAL